MDKVATASQGTWLLGRSPFSIHLTSDNGQNRATTFPLIIARGNGPQSRESRDPGPLSPASQQCPSGICFQLISSSYLNR